MKVVFHRPVIIEMILREIREDRGVRIRIRSARSGPQGVRRDLHGNGIQTGLPVPAFNNCCSSTAPGVVLGRLDSFRPDLIGHGSDQTYGSMGRLEN